MKTTTTLKEAIRSFNVKDRFDLGMRKELFSNFIDRPLYQQASPIVNESVELKDAIIKGDIDEIRKEYADVMYAMLLLTSGLLKDGIIDEEYLKTIGKQQKEKIFKRSPFLKTNEKVDVDTEEKIRYATKGQNVKPIE